MFIDISVGLGEEMLIFPSPYLAPVKVEPVATHAIERRSVQRISFNSHVGTHIDAPYHAIPEGMKIDEIPVDVLCGDCALIHLELDSIAKHPISAEELLPFQELLRDYDRVVLHTGWMTKTWGTMEYFTRGPFLDQSAARLIIDSNIKLLGGDFTNFDSFEDTVPGIPAPRHGELLGSGIVLLENLYHLERITNSVFRLFALPIKIHGADGCPCRVAAEV